MRRFLIFLFVLQVFSGKLSAQSQILGKWLAPEKNVIIQAYEVNGQYFGKIFWLKYPKNAKGVPLKDANNPDPRKRKNKLLGLVVVKNLVYNGKEWNNGEVYNPNTGDSYTCKLWLKNNNILMARGFWGMIYKTQEWTRVP